MRTDAYFNGWQAGYECLAEIKIPLTPAEAKEYVHGYINGTYDRVHENSGDCENS